MALFAGSAIRGCPELVYNATMPQGFSYGMNAWLSFGNGGANDDVRHNRYGGTSVLANFTEWNEAQVTRRTQRTLFADGTNFWFPSSQANIVASQGVRHRNRLNALFVDGHAQSLTSAEHVASQRLPLP